MKLHFLTFLNCTFFLLISTAADAAAAPRFAKPDAWVDVVEIKQVLEKNPSSEAVLVLLDQQTTLRSGLVSSYRDVAVRIDSTKTMSNMMSLFRPVWHPDHGDLIVHRYEIVRGRETTDLTKKEDLFEIIRREKDLERQQVNGRLTAVSQIEDLQLDDIVRLSYTVNKRNSALAGRVQSAGGFVSKTVNVDFVRQIVRWPQKMNLRWRGSREDIVPQKSKKNGWNILKFDYRPEEPKVEIPKNAPMRFRHRNYFEISSFKSWEDVARVNAALYSKTGSITSGGQLDNEIRAIAEQSKNKKQRMALAVRLVQDKIRYLYNGMGFGNYVPQTPEETWRLRYGDCKAKTYLLLAVLRRLGIKAVPMLVNTGQRDAVRERLPSFQAFNHIIVKAELSGKTYWLDGTQNGTRFADLADSPPYRYGLPSLNRGADLEEIPIRKPGRPFQMVKVNYDLKAGVSLPAPFTMHAMLRDSDAQNLRNAVAQTSEDKLKQLREKVALKYVLDGLVTETQFTFDDDQETGYLTAKGLSYLDWETKANRKEHELWSMAGTFKIQKTRDEEELRTLPVNVSFPRHFKYHVTYDLPDRYSAAELTGQLTVNEELGGFQFNRSVHREGNKVVSKEEYYTGRWELAASEFEPERRKLSSLNRKDVAILLPQSIAPAWQEFKRYVQSEGLASHRKAFDDHVTNTKEDDDSGYSNRAYFFQTIGDYQSAIEDLKAALEIETDPENYKWLGDLQLGHDPDAAITSYSKAVEIKPAYYSALLELIRLHIRRDEFFEANTVLKKARNDGLSDVDADSIQIEILQAEGKFSEALEIINQLMKEEPDSARYQADRCMLRAMENVDLGIALEDCTNTIEEAERSSYYHFLRGLVHYRMQNYRLAILDWDKAIRADNEAGYIYRARAAAYSMLGNNAKADENLAAAEFYYKFAGWYWGHFINQPNRKPVRQ